MKYAKDDKEIIAVMGGIVAQMIVTGELKTLLAFGRSIAKTRVETPKEHPELSQEKSDKFADVAIATAVGILLEFCPNPQAVCDLALAKLDEAQTLHAMEKFSMGTKALGDA